MSPAGGCPSWQAMVSVRTSIVPPGPCPPLADTPGTSPAATTPQAPASIRDFAGSLAPGRRGLAEDHPLPGEAPRGLLSCHARRPRGTGPVRFRAAGRAPPPDRDAEGNPQAGLL